MSRRITTVATGVFLASCAALIAGPAAADRECYDQSCRMPDVVEPPAPVEESAANQPAVTEPAVNETTGVVDVVPPQIIEARPPERVRPQMVVDPAPRYQQQPRYSVDAGPRRQQPPRQAERSYESGPVKIVNQGPTYSGLSGGPVYIVNQGPTFGGPGVWPVYREPEVAVVPAYPHNTPAWKLCQMDPRYRSSHAYCGPYDYHPYGAYGYRPNGAYGAPRGGVNVVYTAPSARIIQVEE
jgi:hypothetical protein